MRRIGKINKRVHSYEFTFSLVDVEVPLTKYHRLRCHRVVDKDYKTDVPHYVKGMGFPYSTWNFSEAGHGKGAADGIGGALKRRLDDLVKHGTDIPDAHTAYTLIKNSDTAIMIFYIREDDIAKTSVEEDLVPVPQTMMLHQICNTDETNVIRFRFLSCFCDAPQRGYCECFEVKNHCLVKTFTKENISQRSQSFLKRKTKVTVLSDIRYRAKNMSYDNLQNYRPYKLKRMKKISKDFVLTNSGIENIDYDNPVPSTSGTRIKHVKQSTVKEIQGKKLVKLYSNDSSTDEDDQFSLHDSSDDNFYDEPLSDTTGEENNNVNKKYTGTVIGEKQDNCDFTSKSMTDGVKNANGNVTDKTKDNVVPEKVEKEKFDMTMITDTSTAEQKDENSVVTNTDKNKDCNFTHFSTADVEENNKEITETGKNIETKEMPYYNIDDSVIMSYYLKTMWKYYIGFIEKIDLEEDTSVIMYKIKFQKTVSKPILKFITKKLDYDVVPEIC